VQACSKLNGAMLCDVEKLIANAAANPDEFDPVFWPELAAQAKGGANVRPVSESLYAAVLGRFVKKSTS